MIGNNASLSNAMAAAARTRSCSQWHASIRASRAVGRRGFAEVGDRKHVGLGAITAFPRSLQVYRCFS
jgi:hypothetical protein